MKKFLVLLVLSSYFLLSSALAQENISISGSAANGAGKRIELYRYTDMLTLSEQLVDSTTIAENGHFRLAAYANYPCMMILQVENYSQSFFVEPGRDYEVYIPQFDWNVDERINVHLDPQALPVEFLGMADDDLNALITRYEAVAADYVDNHRLQFDPRFRPQKRYFDSLVIQVNKIVPDGRNEYFNRYKRYQLAQFQYGMKFNTRARLFNRYISGQPILYYDDNYMSLFFTLFAHSLSDGSPRVPLARMVDWVNNARLDTMLDSLGVDSLLRNEQVRELVLLQALSEAYNNRRYYNPASVAETVRLLAAQTKFPEHKTLANNIIASFAMQQMGDDVPPLCLPDADRHTLCLDSLIGNWVYLSFVRVSDPNSIAELETLAHYKDSLYNLYPNLRFVTVSCDRDFSRFHRFLRHSRRGSRYTWTFLHFDGDYRLLDRYGVASYPHFILINPEGKLHYSVTPAPASGILLHGPWQPNPQDTRRDDKASFLR
ncbi:MAG: thioredoxin family protein [Bacteroidales bacterium]|nr:thioredoxin family protein [Bacteroidales bacterium]